MKWGESMDKVVLFVKWKQLVLIFLAGVFAGCIYFNYLWHFQGPVFQNEWGMLFDHFRDESLHFMYSGFYPYLFGLLAFQIVIFFLGIIKWGKIVFRGLTICFGILLGSIETLFLLCFDMRNGFEILLKLICVLGIPAIVLTGSFVLADAFSSLKWYADEKTKKWKKIQWKKYIFFYAWTVILFVSYIFICCYLSFGKINIKFF